MERREGLFGCLVVLAAALAGLGGLAAAVRYLHARYNPTYYGRPLLDWADEALLSEDPASRRRAVEVLREARGREGEQARTRLYYELASGPPDGRSPERLPGELAPFLLEAFREEDLCAGIVALALGKCPPAATAPGVADLLRGERDPYRQGKLLETLGKFGPEARDAVPVIRPLLRDNDRSVRDNARGALKKIDPTEAED
jgi:hypothetical protein